MKRIFTFALAFVMMICVVVPAAFAYAEEPAETDTKNSIDYQTVKARLVTLGSDLRSISLYAKGKYFIKENNRVINNANLTVSYADGTVTMTDANGGVLYTGSEVNLIRSNQVTSAGHVEMNSRKYLGNFRFRCDTNGSGEKYLQVINHVPMVYYLYGVLAGEMSDHFDTDALRAQAIAAKCYAIGSMKAGSNYDLGDTSATQVYKGYDSSWQNIIYAVNSTVSKGLTYNGKVLKTYYAASNGGETNLPSNQWGGSTDNDKGYAVSIDDYDFNSTGTKETLSVKIGEAPSNSKLKGLLAEYAEEELGTDIKEIVSVNDCLMKSPRHDNVSRDMTRVQFDLTVLTENGDQTDVRVEFSASALLSNGIFTNSSLSVYWGQRTDDHTYQIYHARHGHGVGLSQRGARYRADQGQRYDEILRFYYPTATLSDIGITFPEDEEYVPGDEQITTTIVAEDDIISGVKEQESSERGRGILGGYLPMQIPGSVNLLPVVSTPVKGYAYVSVTGAALRTSASSNGVVVDRMSYGDMLTVLGEESSSWLRVQTSKNMTGYISSSQVILLEKSTGASVTYRLAYVNSDSVNFREKPTTQSTSLGKLDKNTAVYVWGTDGDSNDWYHVQCGLTYGYIYSPYLDVEGSYTAQGVAEGSVIASGITTGSVNLRPAPTTSNTPIGLIAKDTYLLIYSYDDGWYNVSVDGKRGYVSDMYVKVNTAIPVSPKDVDVPVLPDAIGTGVVNATDVRFRTSPDTSSSSNIITLLQRGDVLTLFAVSGDWYYAQFDGKMGYVSSQYVDAELYTAPDIDEDCVVFAKGIATASVNFRSCADLSSEVYETLPKNTEFDVIGECGSDWYFIRYNGKCGFVSRKYSKVYQAGNTSLISVPESWQDYPAQTTDGVNLRMGPSTAYSVIQKLSKNEKVTVLAVTGEWSLVDYNGIYGYINSAYLEY